MTSQSTPNEERPHNEERLVTERQAPDEQSGTSGVSDTRRVQLERMEAEAGMQHEATDESVPQRREAESEAGFPSDGIAGTSKRAG